ncbi:thioredoxin family protein [Chitinophaga pendula]|uniref:thioredoxin family protein n=1 Tax=Chitinophaga TaxID=79328 RepID=UPI000BB09103|nr:MULTISPECIES: thioredoxin family protein [Chitinophaga]ASZ11722.1 hypothetical protein CK934_12525 [Chitinophaga sp. MD30]UCJ05258.1 thioredoxin family protein [Chitinophaga pendula]
MIATLKKYTEDCVEEAFLEAKLQQRPLLIDFWSQGCKGCKKMELVTYQDAEVQRYLQEHYVLVKYEAAKVDKAFSDDYLSLALAWSPSFYVYAPDGTIVRQAVGYLSPGQFIAELSLGKAQWLLRKGQPAAAEELLLRISEESAYDVFKQEALYLAGVAAFFKERRDVSAVGPNWEVLLAKYPSSRWAERANVLDIKL